MNIDRGIRARQSKPYPIGVRLTGEEEETYPSDILEAGYNLDKIKVKFLPTQQFPDVISLRTRLTGIPIQNKTCQIQVTVQETINQAAPYYSIENIDAQDAALAKFGQHEAIELYFTGQGQFDGKPFKGLIYNNFQLMLPENQLLYRKNFKTQQGLLSLKHYQNKEGVWEIHLPQKNPQTFTMPLFGYGGFYRKGVSIELIMPIFSTLGFYNGISRPDLYSLDYLQKQSIDPPRGGIRDNKHWYFDDELTEDQQITLASTLKSGAVSLTVQHQQTQRKKMYKSYSFDQTNVRNGEIDIIFMS